VAALDALYAVLAVMSPGNPRLLNSFGVNGDAVSGLFAQVQHGRQAPRDSISSLHDTARTVARSLEAMA
jgi:hypothetical protein